MAIESKLRESVVLNRSITNCRPRSRSGWIMFGALLLSLTLHLWLLFMPQIHLTLFPSGEPKGIDANLVSMLKVRIAEPKVVAPAPAKPQRQKRRPVKAPKPVAPAPSPTASAPVVAADVAAAAEESEAVSEPATESTATPNDAPPMAEGDDPAEAANPVAESQPEPPPESAPAATPEPHPPLQLTVNYSLLKGADGMKVGRVVHTWEINDGHYVISSIMEATGFFALLKRGMFVQSSQGRITAKGLEPESYWEQRGQEADRTFNAQFDYQNKTLTYGTVAEPTTVALPAGTQDQLSFVYQFALKAPFNGTVQFFMTNGRKLGSYAYEAVGEEGIKTELGELRTLHLSKVREQPSDDSVDVWLATDHQYLPVKVRLTNSEGDVAEQVVEGIKEGE